MAVVNLTMQEVGDSLAGPYRRVGQLDPTGQLSTDAEVLLAGSELDARPWDVISFVCRAATNAVTFYVYGSDDPAFAKEVECGTSGGLSAGTTAIVGVILSRFTVIVAADVAGNLNFRYYRVKIKSTGAGSHGTATVTITGHRIN